jgi:hypothetical protein
LKFEYVILLILAFNVVAALVKKRKARAGSAAPKPPSPREERPETASRDERPRAEAREGATASREGAAPSRGMGRDLLEELARELGLETGEPERPRPEVPAYKPEAVAENVAARAQARTDARPVERAPRKAKTAAPEPAAPMRRAPALDLRDVEGLRRAFIAKEVLGPPVSRVRAGR